MKPEITFSHKFVQFIPNELEEGVLYISTEFATATHKCACGCGREVVTPLSPTDWSLTFDGRTISLEPSIGNWSFPCQSHYWIKRDKIRWAPKWSAHQIKAGREYDSIQKRSYFEKQDDESEKTGEEASRAATGQLKISLWQRIKQKLF